MEANGHAGEVLATIDTLPSGEPRVRTSGGAEPLFARLKDDVRR